MQPPENFHKLNDRFQEARYYKDRWLALYKNLYFYVIPDRDAFNIKFNYTDTGKPVTNMIWDSTAMIAAYQRANDLHGLLMPKDRVWGKYVLDPHMHEEQDIQKGQLVLDKINERIMFYINESNVARVVGSSNLDLVGGTGVIWVESPSDDVPLYFRSIPAVALYIEYCNDDLIRNCWYQSKMTGRAVLDTFPDYRGTQFNNLKDNPNDTYSVNYGQIEVGREEYYIYAVLDDDPFTVLWDRYSDYRQIIVYRDRVRPGEAEGRGVGIDMMPTIIDLNRIVEYSRKNMAFKANPPMFYDAGSYFNPYSVRQWAGAMIARQPTGRNPLEALTMPEYPDVYQQVLHMQETIQKAFMVDPLGEIESPVKSATEISVRENRAQRTASTDISRLINELPRQIFEVCAKILNGRGLLLKPKEVIPGFDPRQLKFAFQSPLYDLQNQSDLNHLVTSMQIKQQFYGQSAPLISTDMFEVNRFIMDKLNLPAKLSASDDKMKATLAQAAQQQQQQPPEGAQPSTTAGAVQFPQDRGQTI
jgi:hypothetical protein